MKEEGSDALMYGEAYWNAHRVDFKVLAVVDGRRMGRWSYFTSRTCS